MAAAVAVVSFVFVGYIGLAVLMSIYGGLALYVLWGWFLVPLGVPQIGIAWAIGVSCISAMLMPTVPSPTDEDERLKHLCVILLKPAFALLVGFIAKSFM